ncbi:DUF6346 domain-containing protein [Micromonospora sp. NPDC000442]|uniref:DUF6346 domain-containing protein n=1 Tax=Micromonospora sp. NPDC000442 TaxID=3364217 RepID=UPI0036B08659
MLAWRRHGPVLYRLRQLLFMAVTLVVASVLSLLYLTVVSIYPGTGSVRPHGPAERSVEATVKECRRVGPVSDQGLGFWWVCRILVQQEDGQPVEGIVEGSIADPEKIGSVVTLREACAGHGRTACRYGKPVSVLLSVLYGVFRIAGKALGVFLLLATMVYLFRAIVGAPVYFSLFDKRQAGERSS